MTFKRRAVFYFLTGLTLIAASLACGLGAAPFESAARTPANPLPITALETQYAQATVVSQISGSGEATQTSLPTMLADIFPLVSATPPSVVVAPPPAIPESRRLTLEYPPRIRTGDSDVVRLMLEVDTLGNITPTAEIKGNTIAGQVVQIPNLYDTHNVIAEALLVMAGPEVKPADTISEPLSPGQSVIFFWSVHPTEPGTFRGTVWFHLRFVDKQTGGESQKTISAQPIQIEATQLFGLSGDVARATGGIGSIVGAVLGLPFLDDILKWLWGRFKLKS